jgi:hypothetical protein
MSVSTVNSTDLATEQRFLSEEAFVKETKELCDKVSNKPDTSDRITKVVLERSLYIPRYYFYGIKFLGETATPSSVSLEYPEGFNETALKEFYASIKKELDSADEKAHYTFSVSVSVCNSNNKVLDSRRICKIEK